MTSIQPHTHEQPTNLPSLLPCYNFATIVRQTGNFLSRVYQGEKALTNLPNNFLENSEELYDETDFTYPD